MGKPDFCFLRMIQRASRIESSRSYQHRVITRRFARLRAITLRAAEHGPFALLHTATCTTGLACRPGGCMLAEGVSILCCRFSPSRRYFPIRLIRHTGHLWQPGWKSSSQAARLSLRLLLPFPGYRHGYVILQLAVSISYPGQDRTAD